MYLDIFNRKQDDNVNGIQRTNGIAIVERSTHLNPLIDWHAVSALQRRKFITIKPIVDLYTSYYKCIIQMKLLKNMHVACKDIDSTNTVNALNKSFAKDLRRGMQNEAKRNGTE